MIEILKQLLQKQKEIFKNGNFKQLNEINKQIFEIREQTRKEKAKAREKEQDEKIANKICLIMEL